MGANYRRRGAAYKEYGTKEYKPAGVSFIPLITPCTSSIFLYKQKHFFNVMDM